MDSMDLCNVQYSNYSFTCLEMDNSRENIGKFFFLSDTKDGGLYLNYNFQVKNKTFGKMIDRHARQQRHSPDLMLSIM